MTGQRGLRAVPVSAFAVAGVLLGHWLAYLAALPHASVRSATLWATGHTYWSEAVRMAMALGVCGLAALVLVHVSDRNERTLAPSQRLSSLVLQLGAIQSGAFLAMEIIERVAAHVPVATLFTGHVLVLGLAFQVLTASLGALLLRWLHRAVAAVVGVLRASCRSPVATTTGGVPDAPFVLRAAMTGASGLRGPPFA